MKNQIGSFNFEVLSIMIYSILSPYNVFLHGALNLISKDQGKLDFS